MSFVAWFYLAVSIALLVRIVRELGRPQEERSLKKIVTDGLFMMACVYMLLGRLAVVPRI